MPSLLLYCFTDSFSAARWTTKEHFQDASSERLYKTYQTFLSRIEIAATNGVFGGKIGYTLPFLTPNETSQALKSTTNRFFALGGISKISRLAKSRTSYSLDFRHSELNKGQRRWKRAAKTDFKNHLKRPYVKSTTESWNKQHSYSTAVSQRTKDFSDAEFDLHIIVHSHTDLGWVKTYNSFQTTTNGILWNINKRLKNDKNRKFTLEHIGFFGRFYDESASNEVKDWYQSAIKEGKVELLNMGAVAMQDEACSYYSDLMVNYRTGRDWLLDRFPEFGEKIENRLSKTAYKIDSFGHSLTTMRLAEAAGATNLLIGRADFVQKRIRAYENILDFPWDYTKKQATNRQTEAKNNKNGQSNPKKPTKTARMMVHLLYGHYDYMPLLRPYFYGQGRYTAPNPLDDHFADRRILPWLGVTKELNYLADRHYNRTIPGLFGSDFDHGSYTDTFGKLESFVIFLKSNEKGRAKGIKIGYSSLRDYFEKMKNVKEIHGTEEIGKKVNGDFYPYTGRVSEYFRHGGTWTGFYFSHQYYKKFYAEFGRRLRGFRNLVAERFLGNLFQINNLYNTLSGTSKAAGKIPDAPLTQKSKIDDFSRKLKMTENQFKRLEKSLQSASWYNSVLTHHDAISGTSPDFVMRDYKKGVQIEYDGLPVVASFVATPVDLFAETALGGVRGGDGESGDGANGGGSGGSGALNLAEMIDGWSGSSQICVDDETDGDAECELDTNTPGHWITMVTPKATKKAKNENLGRNGKSGPEQKFIEEAREEELWRIRNRKFELVASQRESDKDLWGLEPLKTKNAENDKKIETYSICEFTVCRTYLQIPPQPPQTAQKSREYFKMTRKTPIEKIKKKITEFEKKTFYVNSGLQNGKTTTKTSKISITVEYNEKKTTLILTTNLASPNYEIGWYRQQGSYNDGARQNNGLYVMAFKQQSKIKINLWKLRYYETDDSYVIMVNEAKNKFGFFQIKLNKHNFFDEKKFQIFEVTHYVFNLERPLPYEPKQIFAFYRPIGLISGQRFFTDSNGLDLIPRYYGKNNKYEELSYAREMNFYPVTKIIATENIYPEDSQYGVGVLVDRPVAATITPQGSIEVGLQRRTLHDDDKGVPGSTGDQKTVVLKHRLVYDSRGVKAVEAMFRAKQIEWENGRLIFMKGLSLDDLKKIKEVEKAQVAGDGGAEAGKVSEGEKGGAEGAEGQAKDGVAQKGGLGFAGLFGGFFDQSLQIDLEIDFIALRRLMDSLKKGREVEQAGPAYFRISNLYEALKASAEPYLDLGGLLRVTLINLNDNLDVKVLDLKKKLGEVLRGRKGASAAEKVYLGVKSIEETYLNFRKREAKKGEKGPRNVDEELILAPMEFVSLSVTLELVRG